MTTPGLGRLERVDVRTIWRREAHDFTPWLATKENISLLADALEIELVPTSREVRVGDYRACLLVRRAKRGFQAPGRTHAARNFRDLARGSLKDLRRAEGLVCRCF
jgi:hypothetical protein